jgi:hypothetical protein
MAKPVPMVRPRSANEIERAADRILEKHGKSTLAGKEPFDIVRFVDGPLEDLCEIEFEVQDLGPNIEGRFENRTLILSTRVYQGAVRGRNRDRFTTAHECGHAVLHANELDVINEWQRGKVALFRREDIVAYRNPEWQANQFAGAVLMPLAGVRAVLANGPCLSASIATSLVAATFRVSEQAAEIRVNKLLKGGLITL